MFLPDPGALIFVLAAVAANRARTSPLWALLVGPPAGGKTEIVNSVAGIDGVFPAATLTEASLLSGTPKREQAHDARGGLLRTIGDVGIILCKDFGSVLSMPRDARSALLAALREVFDGAWTRHVGTDGGRTLTWAGKVGLIAACTPAIDLHHAVTASMGERFIYYRLPPTDTGAQARRALAQLGHETEMRAALAAAVASVIEAADITAITAPPDPETTDALVALADLAVRCRSSVERDGFRREIDFVPPPESPARLVQVLLLVWNAVIAIGGDQPTAWRIVTKCALDSMPAIRQSVLRTVIEQNAGLETAQVVKATHCPTTTVRRALEDLEAHGVLRREPRGNADTWFVEEWAGQRWKSIPGMSDSTPARAISEMSTTGRDSNFERADDGGASRRDLPDVSETAFPGSFASTAVEADYPRSAWSAD
jgi:hypothetical protein